jgi:deltex-like protein
MIRNKQEKFVVVIDDEDEEEFNGEQVNAQAEIDTSRSQDVRQQERLRDTRMIQSSDDDDEEWSNEGLQRLSNMGAGSSNKDGARTNDIGSCFSTCKAKFTEDDYHYEEDDDDEEEEGFADDRWLTHKRMRSSNQTNVQTLLSKFHERLLHYRNFPEPTMGDVLTTMVSSDLAPFLNEKQELACYRAIEKLVVEADRKALDLCKKQSDGVTLDERSKRLIDILCNNTATSSSLLSNVQPMSKYFPYVRIWIQGLCEGKPDLMKEAEQVFLLTTSTMAASTASSTCGSPQNSSAPVVQITTSTTAAAPTTTTASRNRTTATATVTTSVTETASKKPTAVDVSTMLDIVESKGVQLLNRYQLLDDSHPTVQILREAFPSEQHMEITEVFECGLRQEEYDYVPFKTCSENSSILLSHCARQTSSLHSILESGLRRGSAGLLGPGIYVSTDISKCLMYSSPKTLAQDQGTYGIVLVAECQLGHVEDVFRPTNSQVPGCDTARGVGRTAPIELKLVTFKDGSQSKIYTGRAVNKMLASQESPTAPMSTFAHEEFAIYDSCRVRVRFILVYRHHNYRGRKRDAAAAMATAIAATGTTLPAFVGKTSNVTTDAAATGVPCSSSTNKRDVSFTAASRTIAVPDGAVGTRALFQATLRWNSLLASLTSRISRLRMGSWSSTIDGGESLVCSLNNDKIVQLLIRDLTLLRQNEHRFIPLFVEEKDFLQEEEATLSSSPFGEILFSNTMTISKRKKSSEKVSTAVQGITLKSSATNSTPTAVKPSAVSQAVTLKSNHTRRKRDSCAAATVVSAAKEVVVLVSSEDEEDEAVKDKPIFLPGPTAKKEVTPSVSSSSLSSSAGLIDLASPAKASSSSSQSIVPTGASTMLKSYTFKGQVQTLAPSVDPSFATTQSERANREAGSEASGRAAITAAGATCCIICLENIISKSHEIKLNCCTSAIFHRSCLETCFSLTSKQCPICRHIFEPLQGNCPPGRMITRLNHSRSFIEITYVIPSGIQGPTHPMPGQPFTGTTRRAFLPNTSEGNEVLQLLTKAFDAQLTFTVGTSLTTGQANTVVWNGIHHKTSLGGGVYGFPDPTYFSRVKDELAQKGIR